MTKQEAVDEWLKALRSGEYKQGKSALRSEKDEYCCLGVLSNLQLDTAGCKWVPNGDVYELTGAPGYFRIGTVLEEIRSTVGLRDHRGGFTSTRELRAKALAKGIKLPEHDGWDNEAFSLIELNDTLGWSFSQIADLIELHPPNLFDW